MSVRCDFCDILIFPPEYAIRIDGTHVPTGRPAYPSRRLVVCQQCSYLYGIECPELSFMVEPDKWSLLSDSARHHILEGLREYRQGEYEEFETIEDLHSQGELT